MSEMDETDVTPAEPSNTAPQSTAPQSTAPQSTAPQSTDSQSTASQSPAPRGIGRVCSHSGKPILDAMAGRASVFGFGFQPITDAIREAAEGYLGDGCRFADPSGDATHNDDSSSLLNGFRRVLNESTSLALDSVFLESSADAAIETAIRLARTRGSDSAYRTIAMLGSDHGRTGVCRTASGRPELHEGYGPMMAGFSHVPAGDLDAVRAVVDDQTACILTSTIDLGDAARACDRDYLAGLRDICDERDLLLVIDETQLAFGSSGRPFAFSSITDVHADMVVVAGGLLGGLPGGIVLGSQRATGEPISDTSRFPMLKAVVSTTLNGMAEHGLPASINESMQDFAVSMAERLSQFEFVRDVNVLGLTIGIETDLQSNELVRAADEKGLRLEAAGETAIRLQPPLLMSEEDQRGLLERLGETMESIERETAEIIA